MASTFKGLIFLLVSIISISSADDLSQWRQPKYFGKEEVRGKLF